MAEAKKTAGTTAKQEEVKEAELVVEAAPEQSLDLGSQITETADEKVTAKAGKRSSKALKEAEEKVAKEERKAHASEEKTDEKPKATVVPSRTRLERQGKNFRKVAEQVEKDKDNSLKEAMELATKTSYVKFDASVELHIRLGVDPKQADQNIRATVVLPAGTGKTVRVAVFAEADDVVKAKAAGADVAGSDDFLAQIEKGKLDFDVLVSTPTMMAKLGKYAKILGPKGLMPNPKSGTVTKDVAKAVKEAKAGKVEYRVDSTGIVHVGIGKVSFGGDKLLQNAQAILSSLKSNKPATLKTNYVLSIYAATSMGPSIKIANSEI